MKKKERSNKSVLALKLYKFLKIHTRPVWIFSFREYYLCRVMKRIWTILIVAFILSLFTVNLAQAQCSICTRTAQQLGEKPAKGLNAGILYLAFTPLIIGGIIGYRWWRNNKND